ncbi:MAG TPA: hypothetical protein VGS79_26130 [Puia sp.]|nr:hypothetical protein [Puia sp.]
MRTEINNKPQTTGTKNDKKNKQDVLPAIRSGKISESQQTAKVCPSDEPHPAAPAAASYAQQPHAQQNTAFQPKGDRYIRSWVESLPDQQK